METLAQDEKQLDGASGNLCAGSKILGVTTGSLYAWRKQLDDISGNLCALRKVFDDPSRDLACDVNYLMLLVETFARYANYSTIILEP